MPFVPEPTASELRVTRIYCIVLGVVSLVPTILAAQLRGLLSWQFILFGFVTAILFLSATVLPAKFRVVVGRYIL